MHFPALTVIADRDYGILDFLFGTNRGSVAESTKHRISSANDPGRLGVIKVTGDRENAG
jgi:hypothetical protein